MKKKFIRQEHHRYKKLKKKWRKPKGRHSKMRLKIRGKPKSPSIGYRGKKSERGLHPSGYVEVLVENVSQLSKVKKDKEAIRISGRVGRKKRELIIEKAQELGIKILNR